MSDDEVLEILFYGMEPDAHTVWGWEVRKAARESLVAKQFRDAFSRQKK